MAFRTNAAPYQRSKKSTTQIMIILCIALAIVWVCGIVNTFKLQPSYGAKSILMVIVSVVISVLCDVVTTLIRHKKESKLSLGKDIVHNMIYNYSYVTGIIFALTLPVYASYYVVIVGAVFATVVVKNFFGGFGRNIFNPAIMARIFVALCFAFTLPTSSTGLDASTGATITTAFNNTTHWLADSAISGFSLKDILFGNYLGALGETFTIVILLLGIVLSVLKVINWRTPVFYIGTVAITSFVIAVFCGFENPFTYVLYQLSLGGLMFGAVFMITDPVTGPTSSFGKSLIGVIAGFLTVLIRVKGGYPEGVMFSIAIVNAISPVIDYVTTGKTNSKLVVKYSAVFGTLLVSVALCTGISYSVNGGKEQYSINGISRQEYQAVIDAGFDLKDKDQLSVKEDGYEAYFVINSEGNKVAAVYKVTPPKVEFGTSYPLTINSSDVYVAININDRTLYDLAFEGLVGTNNNYSNLGSSFASELNGMSADQIASKDSAAGASYSSQFVKSAVESGYILFNLEYSVSINLHDGDSFTSGEGGDEIGFVVNSSSEKVAVVYEVVTDAVPLFGGSMSIAPATVYVAINLSDATIYSITTTDMIGTAESFSNLGIAWSEEVEGTIAYSVGDVDVAAGASYSTQVIKDAVAKAVSLFDRAYTD